MNEFLADAMLRDSSRWPGPKNPHPLQNPLSGKAEAYELSLEKLLLQHGLSCAFVRSNEFTPTEMEVLRFHLETDTALTRKRYLIANGLMNQEMAVREQALSSLSNAIKAEIQNQHLNDMAGFNRKMDSDPAFRSQFLATVHATGEEMDRKLSLLRGTAMIQMRVVADQWADGWVKRQ
jgi:hypothetical protein